MTKILLICLLGLGLNAEGASTPAFVGTLPTLRTPNDLEFPLKEVNDTKRFPYRTIGRLATGCTGTLIGPRYVLTAAHCVYSMDEDVFYDELQFTPGQKGTDMPFGTIDWETVHVPDEWSKNHNTDFDFAVIRLKTAVGYQLGWLGVGTLDSEPARIQITGYPGEKPPKTPWSSVCEPLELTKKWLNYTCETQGGMSGSGVLDLGDLREFTVVGIHALGGDTYNSAVRVTKSVYKNIQSWINK